MNDTRRSGVAHAILGFGFVLLLLQLGVLVFAGPPATHDGFWHLNWIEALNHAVYREGTYPRWYAEAFGGAGSPSFVFYPPLFRLLSLPFGAFSAEASSLTAGAIALVIVLNATAACLAARALRSDSPAAAWLPVLAVANPYLGVNLWLRGAWPEALAMGFLWCFLAALLHARRGEFRAAFALGTVAAAGVLLSHHPTALLLGYAALPVAAALAWQREGRALLVLMAAACTGGVLSSFHLLPAVLDQDSIRLATGERLNSGHWPQWYPDQAEFVGDLAWLWLWTTACAVAGTIALLHTRAGRVLLLPAVLLAILASLLMLPVSAPLQAALPYLGRVQFPWRWLGPGSIAAIAILVVLICGGKWRAHIGWGLALAGFVAGGWILRRIEFMPIALAQLDRIVACERAGGDCSRFEAPAELRDEHEGLRFIGQHRTHYGPWVDTAGRVWRYEVPDYLPHGIFIETWSRAPRNRTVMAPYRPAPGLQAEPREALVVAGARYEGQRVVMDLHVAAPVEVTLERLRFAGWEWRVRPEGGEYRHLAPDPESPYYRVRLAPGSQRLQLRQVGTRAERVGEAVSASALLLLAVICAWRWRRAGRSLRPAPGTEEAT
jgi:hypothetical protein